jgi:hypothetical protein
VLSNCAPSDCKIISKSKRGSSERKSELIEGAMALLRVDDVRKPGLLVGAKVICGVPVAELFTELLN